MRRWSKELFSLFGREYNGLHEAALLLGISALASQILALIRDRLLAGAFGAGELLDIYYASFRIPDFIYIFIASFISLTVLIPYLTKKIEGNGDEAKKFLDSVFTSFFVVIIIVSILAFFLIPPLTGLVVPGFGPEAQNQYALLARILLLSPIFLGFSNLLAGITQTYRKFFVYALSPVLYNLGIIVGIIFFYPRLGMAGLAWGVILGAFLHFFIQVPAVWRLRLMPAPTSRINWREVKEVALVSLPRTIALGAHQLVVLVLVALASVLTTGSIAVFNFSFNLQSVPLAIIGVSYSLAAFPTLTRLFSGGERDKFLEQIITASRHIIFWSLPVAALFIVLRAQIVRVILGTGQFGWTETSLVAAALAIFVISVVAQNLVLLFVRGYYAAGKTKKPLFINVFSSFLIIILAFAFSRIFAVWQGFRFFFESLLRVTGLPGTEVLMLPLAFSLGLIVNVLIFWFVFQKDFAAFAAPLRRTFAHSFYSAEFAGFVAYLGLSILDDFLDINTFVGIFSQGLLSGLAGVIAGILLLKLLGNREIEDIEKALSHRFWKIKPPPAPTPEETQLL